MRQYNVWYRPAINPNAKLMSSGPYADINYAYVMRDKSTTQWRGEYVFWVEEVE